MKNDKFAPLLAAGTNGINAGFDTQAVIERLRAWDDSYGIEISNVESDAVLVRFSTLPSDLVALAKEVYEFCPDTVDQHFGVLDEDTVQMILAQNDDRAKGFKELVDGIDFSDPGFGLELLRRSIERSRSIALWWD